MKKLEDFIASARSIHDAYAAGRMDREIVRLWSLGLSDYPVPYGRAVAEAKAWFKKSPDGVHPVDLKAADIVFLRKMYDVS